MTYLVKNAIRKRVHAGKKRVRPEFIDALDRHVSDLIERAVDDSLLRNNKTLGALEAEYVIRGWRAINGREAR